MAAVTICSDFGGPKSKVSHCFHCFPIYLPWSDETGCQDLSFLNVEVFFFLLFLFKKNFFNSLFLFILLYNILLVLPYINMNPPRVYMCSPSWTSLPPPSPYQPSGSSQAPAPNILYHASNLDWRFILYMILYVFNAIFPKSSHPRPLPESKRLFYTSVSLLLSRIQGYCYHLSKFHIYALVYCIGVFLSGLLHSV